MNIPSSNNTALLMVIRKLGMGEITGGETLFLFRRVRCATDLDAWTTLAETYGLDGTALYAIEKMILRRLSLDGLLEVELWLNGWWAGKDYISKLPQNERTNLHKLVKRAISLHTRTAGREQMRPAPAPLLACDEREQLARLEGENLPRHFSNLKPTSAKEQFSTQNGPITLPPVRPAHSLPTPSLQHKAAETRPNKVPCPLVIVDSLNLPEKFLEALFNIHVWLSEAPRTVGDLRQFVVTQWQPMNHSDFQKALNLFYSVGMIGLTTGLQSQALVMPMLAANLTVSQFRRACAEHFTQRIPGNAVLLATIDQLYYASPEQLKQVIIDGRKIMDLIVRLLIWEAFGIIQRQRKDVWQITQAGRTLVAALQLMPFVTANEAEPIPSQSDNDWLDVL